MAKKPSIDQQLKNSAYTFATKILKNPVSPKEPFIPRWNQAPILEPPYTSRLNTVRAQRGCGKLLDIHTKIPTPTGWTTMGELALGDTVFDENGKPCMVTFVSYIEEEHECYTITFDDGVTIVAGPEHQWLVDTKASRRAHSAPQVLTTADMLDRLYVGNHDTNYSITLTQPLDCPTADLPVDPYMLGWQLGEVGRGYIPLWYQRASVAQRMAALTGLMDAAGRVRRGRCEYSSQDAGLVHDVYLLVLGLGFKATKKQNVVRFTASSPVFTSPQKLAQQPIRRNTTQRRYIKSIEKTTPRSLCCIGVDSPNHLYLAGEECIVTHNTEGIVAWLIWYAWTHGDRIILILGPSELVVQRVFEKINFQVANSPFLAGSVTVNRKKPYELHLSNGTKIRGLSTGVASKKGAQNVRGEHPHVIYIDEADYLNDNDWDAFMPLIDPSDPNDIKPIVWATTTPTGKRSRFYFLCEDKTAKGVGHDWKDWWFPARHWPDVTFEGPYTTDDKGWAHPTAEAVVKCVAVNTEWTKDADDRQRRNGEQVYYHEILAWWGDATYAVWNKKLIEESILRGKRFNYLQGREQATQCFTGGCDIDERQALPNFCIVEYVPSQKSHDGSGGTYIVRYRDEMDPPANGRINVGLKNTIIDLDHKFNPRKFYVDRGYGSLLVDEIVDLGVKSVEGKWFRENVDVVNAESGEITKKPLKHLMISVATRLFEEGRISLPPISKKSVEFDVFNNMREVDDPTPDEDFINDLVNYQVVNVTKTGVPEYTSQNEHSIDAFLLALFAAVQTFDDFIGDFHVANAATSIPTNESTILGGSVARVQTDKPRVDESERTVQMSVDEFLHRASRRANTPQRSFAGSGRSSF